MPETLTQNGKKEYGREIFFQRSRRFNSADGVCVRSELGGAERPEGKNQTNPGAGVNPARKEPMPRPKTLEKAVVITFSCKEEVARWLQKKKRNESINTSRYISSLLETEMIKEMEKELLR